MSKEKIEIARLKDELNKLTKTCQFLHFFASKWGNLEAENGRLKAEVEELHRLLARAKEGKQS